MKKTLSYSSNNNQKHIKQRPCKLARTFQK